MNHSRWHAQWLPAATESLFLPQGGGSSAAQPRRLPCLIHLSTPTLSVSASQKQKIKLADIMA